MKHVISIRSKYLPQAPLSLNQSRLTMTENTCVPSLARQTHGEFSLHLYVSDSDPLLKERLAAFECVGVPILTEISETACVTRMDDDDMLAPTFVERLVRANPVRGWYTFSNGYVRGFDGLYYHRRYKQNQFVSRVCRVGESPYDVHHPEVKGATQVDDVPAWVWCRHKHSITEKVSLPKECRTPGLVSPDWTTRRPRLKLQPAT
jgi:hypothetical protein